MPGSLRATQLRQQRLWSDDPNASMLSYGEKVPAVSRDERIHFRPNRRGEDQVIVRIAGYVLWRAARRGGRMGRQAEEEILGLPPALRLEAELPGENSLQLHHRRRKQDELQSAVDRLLENAAWRSGGDEGRDQNVGVAGDAQGQLRPERISSTSVSLSSGPTPRVSARPRP